MCLLCVSFQILFWVRNGFSIRKLIFCFGIFAWIFSLISSSILSLSVFLISSYLDVEPPWLIVYISYFLSFIFLYLFALPSGRISHLCLSIFLLSFFPMVFFFLFLRICLMLLLSLNVLYYSILWFHKGFTFLTKVYF